MNDINQPKKRSVIYFILLLLVSFTQFPLSTQAQHQGPQPRDVQQRIQIKKSISILRAQLEQHPVRMHQPSKTSQFVDGDSTETGGVAGQLEGITAADNPWVLIVAAHLWENPTAWSFAEIEDEGRFFATDLSHGTYFIMAGADGYAPQFYDQAMTLWDAIPVEIVPGEITQEIYFRLLPSGPGTGQITGSVSAAESGEPVDRAYVYAFSRENPFSNASVDVLPDGSYTLDGLHPGSYYVQAWADGYLPQFYEDATQIENATLVEVGDEDTVEGIDFNLRKAGSISGRVVNEEGVAIAHADIEVIPAFSDPDNPTGEFQYAWTTTDEEGFYTASGLVEGSYWVSARTYTPGFVVMEWYDNVTSFEDATPVTVVENEDTGNVHFELDLSFSSGSMAGQVLDAAGEPVAGAYVRLEPIDRDFYFFDQGTTTDDNGNYVLEEVPVGSYRVVLEYWTEQYYLVYWFDNAFSREEATVIEITEDERLENINFALPSADGSLAGKVVDADGNPFANVTVQAWLGGRDYWSDFGYGLSYTQTDEDGTFLFENLIDGEYLVSAFVCQFYECYEVWWPAGRSQEEAEPVVVRNGTSEPSEVTIEIPVSRGTASISGIVSDENGAPLANAYISLSGSETYTDEGIAWVFQMQTTTKEDGSYTLPYLPEGTFVIQASYWKEGVYGYQWFDHVSDFEQATPVVLSEGEAREDVHFDIPLIPLYGSITGQVTSTDGIGIERALIRFYSFYEDIHTTDPDIAYWGEYYAISDAEGIFNLENVPNGVYSVQAFAQDAIWDENAVPGDSTSIIEVIGGQAAVLDIVMRQQDGGNGQILGNVGSTEGSLLEVAVVQAYPAFRDDSAPYTAIVTEGGSFEINNLPEGDYYVKAFAPWHIGKYYNDAYDPSDAELVGISENTPPPVLDFALEPIYYLAEPEFDGEGRDRSEITVFGKVTTESGDALEGATVYVMAENGTAMASGETQADGSYQIGALLSGHGYTLKATHAGFESRYHDKTSDPTAMPVLKLNSGRYEINFTLEPAVTSTDIETPDASLPGSITLNGNYPNPFNPSTRINFSTTRQMPVRVAVYDALGREMTVLFDGLLGAGEHSVTWDAATSQFGEVPSGLYFYRVTSDVLSQTGTMMLVR